MAASVSANFILPLQIFKTYVRVGERKTQGAEWERRMQSVIWIQACYFNISALFSYPATIPQAFSLNKSRVWYMNMEMLFHYQYII